MRAPSLITLGFVTAFTLFNLQPYVGSRFLSCQTMYSGLSPLAPGNHLFLPRLRWFDTGDYLVQARLGTDRVHARAVVAPVAVEVCFTEQQAQADCGGEPQ